MFITIFCSLNISKLTFSYCARPTSVVHMLEGTPAVPLRPQMPGIKTSQTFKEEQIKQAH